VNFNVEVKYVTVYGLVWPHWCGVVLYPHRYNCRMAHFDEV